MKVTLFAFLAGTLLLAGCASDGRTTNPQVTTSAYGPYTQSPFYPQMGPGGGGAP